MSNIQYLPPVPTAGATTFGGGGQALRFRDPLDARRSMIGNRVPSAEYPDGYLGTITSRREDRLLDSLKNRLTERSYQRGVHKGERIDPSDYFWPREFNPQTALKAEARGQRWTQRGNPIEHLAHQGKFAARDPDEVARDRANALVAYGLRDTSRAATELDPFRTERMARLLPGWK